MRTIRELKDYYHGLPVEELTADRIQELSDQMDHDYAVRAQIREERQQLTAEAAKQNRKGNDFNGKVSQYGPGEEGSYVRSLVTGTPWETKNGDYFF
ncbi:MAG: hypothetical protein LUF78_07580 [Clostridiales bacterium]|nr:hypothetical protein [Clostridiales bacterium]